MWQSEINIELVTRHSCTTNRSNSVNQLFSIHWRKKDIRTTGTECQILFTKQSSGFHQYQERRIINNNRKFDLITSIIRSDVNNSGSGNVPQTLFKQNSSDCNSLPIIHCGPDNKITRLKKCKY